ncbi:hypothetical protein LTR62_004356 [Meristemomyces frigidus]|uniref:DUF6924 domain-containing protein n=1 Tax=Meristemomyces frigidus TaxID=1508187 RepID=A0AAN7TE59_9PEZI|nr:hypothetical protein LTR62_004356 [Meristemomyces frigidus]
MQNRTCILGNRGYDDDADEEKDSFARVRVPWTEVYPVFCNLDIANMDFEDFAETEEDVDEDGCFPYVSSSSELDDRTRKRKDELLEQLKQDGSL